MFDAAAWGHAPGSGHMIVAIGYDNTGIFTHNSWGSTYQNYHFTWEQISKYAWKYSTFSTPMCKNIN